MKLKIFLLIILMMSVLALNGCNLINVDPQALMHPPKAIGELRGIEDALYKSVGSDITLIYPKSQENRSAFILKDIDDDKSNEVLAFYMLNTNKTEVNGSLAPHINLIEKVNGKWKSVYDSVIDASGIDNITFADLTGDGKIEIIAGCSMYSATENKLIVFGCNNGKLNIRMNETYSLYTLCDLNYDKKPEIFLTTINSANKSSKAKLISINNDGIVIIGSCDMDGNITSYGDIYTAKITDKITGVYIDAYKGQNAMITELVFLKNGQLFNPFYDTLLLVNQVTLRESAVLSQDIDKDGFIDIPEMIVLPGYENFLLQDRLYLTVWRRFGGEYFANTLTCMMNDADGYYFTFLDNWVGNVTVQSYNNERKRVFSRWDFAKGKAADEIFSLQVFAQETWDKNGPNGFSEVARKDKLIYAVKMNVLKDKYTVNIEDIKARFHFILNPF
jgi:hypothetical protein